MITCSNIGFGNQLGAQMTNFADLYYIAKENNQSVKLLSDFRYFRRGYQFVEAFDFPENMLESDNGLRGGKSYTTICLTVHREIGKVILQKYIKIDGVNI